MSEINLLPDELRDKDRKASNQNKPTDDYRVSWSNPPRQSSAPVDEKPKQSWFGGNKNTNSDKDLIVKFNKEQDQQTAPSNNNIPNKSELPKVEPKPIKSELEKGIKELEKKKNKFKLFGLFSKNKSNKKPKVEDFKENNNFKEDIKKSGIDVNLMPKEINSSSIPEFSNLFKGSVLTIMFSLLMLAIGLGGLLWYEYYVTSKANELRATITSLDSELKGLDKQKVEALEAQKRLSVVRDLLDQHVYWSKFFGFLEKNTINEVYYTNFSMNGRDRLVVSAVGRDYNSVAKQLVAFEQAQDFIKNVRVDSASAIIDPETFTYSGVEFNIHLEFQSGVFFKSLE